MRALLLAAALSGGTFAAVAQLPAGTRDAADTTQAEAGAAKLRAAESALEQGDFAAAAQQLKVLAADQPNNPQILYDLGFAEERVGETDGAAKAYADAIAAAPSLAEPRVALGLLDARAGRVDKARGELAAAAQLEGVSPQLRGRSYRALAQLNERTDPAAASAALLAAIKLTGETPDDTALSAALAARSGDPASAEAAYRRALASRPDDIETAAGLAHLLLQSQRASEAEELLVAPLKAHPDDPRLVSQMASIYAAEGKTKEAIPLLAQLRTDARFASDDSLARQLARLYEGDGQHAQAEQLFKEVLAKNPDDAPLLDDLGSVLVRQQKYPEAQAVLSRAVELRDKFPTPADFGEAAGHLAFAASRNGQPSLTLQALKWRATVLPNSGPSLFLEATAHDSLHQFKEAERSYRAFLAIAAGQFPDQEFQARHRLVALEHMK